MLVILMQVISVQLHCLNIFFLLSMLIKRNFFLFYIINAVFFVSPYFIRQLSFPSNGKKLLVSIMRRVKIYFCPHGTINASIYMMIISKQQNDACKEKHDRTLNQECHRKQSPYLIRHHVNFATFLYRRDWRVCDDISFYKSL